jgi:hypothetical protein
MPSKRTAATKRSAPKKKRLVESEAPRRIFGEEKRELILAHAAMRQKANDPVQVMTLWIGVAVTMLVVVAGWVWALSPALSKAFRQPLDQGSQTVLNEIKKGNDASPAKQQLEKSDFPKILEQTTAALQNLNAQAVQEQQALDALAAAVNSTSTSSTADGSYGKAFQPVPTSTGKTPKK